MVKEAQNVPGLKDFSIKDYNSNDQTQTVLTYPGNVFILFAKDISTANTSNMKALQKLVTDCKALHIPIIGISASSQEETSKFKQTNQIEMDFFTIDGTACKTAMRTNPGLMMIKGGNILGKWSYADYPVLDQLKPDITNNTKPLFDLPANGLENAPTPSSN